MNPGQIIRKLRQEKGMTLSALAKTTNLDPGNLSRIERGELNINFTLLERLSISFNVSPSVFFDKNFAINKPINFIQSFRIELVDKLCRLSKTLNKVDWFIDCKIFIKKN